MNNEKHQEKVQRESTEEFCKRLGIRMNKRSGGVEFSPYPGGNLLHKRPKQSSKNRSCMQLVLRFCNCYKRLLHRPVHQHVTKWLYVELFTSGNSFHNHRQLRTLHVVSGWE